ncbi:hypothetical protein NADFUDRAFT_42410 [Nadsonia fulvescens var. elongata DSM 6958]|uniref:TUG ubiquitin-like domain-containing protein n=1 Tax=Nadsonia fulvescens var. elongata DSM 6958 TaxID=857566 RepID=A0A1E3PJU4_9ASCO|nr:hypothetical protein NADFUDRAFT_42410 [Nadsonia fulvescens var. elongata DSM 6958]
MSLSVTFNNRTIRVATTPSMLLSDIRNKVSATLLPAGEIASDYSLRKSDKVVGFNSSGVTSSTRSMTASQLRVRASKGLSNSGTPTSLDLSLPIRLSGLPTGTKLELFKLFSSNNKSEATLDSSSTSVSTSSTVSSLTTPARSASVSPSPEMVKIKLVLVDLPVSFSNNMIESFSLNTSLWQMLVHFQTVSGVNLTNRMFQAEGNSTAQYEISQLQTISKVISSLVELLDLTLRDLAFRSGSNEAIRVKWVDSGISYEDFLSQLALRGLSVLEQTPKPMNLDDVKSDNGQNMDMDCSAVNSGITAASTVTDSIAAENSGESPARISTPLERSLHIFTPSSHNDTTSNFNDNEEEEYKLTTAQARVYQAQLSKLASPSSGPLLTKTLRDQAHLQKRVSRAPSVVFVRVRLPNMTYIQAQFDGRETLGDVIKLVRQQLNEEVTKGVRVQLFRNEGKIQRVLVTEPLISPELPQECPSKMEGCQVEDQGFFLTLAHDLGFCKRELLDSRFVDNKSQVVNLSGPLLKETVMQLAQELTVAADSEPNVTSKELSSDERTQSALSPNVKSSNSTKKIPKWLKLGKK